jgi:hypothetical protein
MTAAAVLAVKRADTDQTCRRCNQPIHRGRRVVLLASVGAVHLRCVPAPATDTNGRHDDAD